MDRPVLIVGGGIAGLSAAKRLKENGVPVLVLEGRDRLGGRIDTIDVAGEQASWIDMGAAFIDEHQTNRVFHLLNDAGAEVHPTSFRLFGQRFFDQRSARWKGRIAAALATVRFGWRFRKLQAQSPDFASLDQRINALLGERHRPEDMYLLKSVLELLRGGPAEHTHPNVSAKNYWEYLSYKEKGTVMVTGGFRLLVDLTSKPLSDSELLLRQTVTRISVGQDAAATPSVLVETADGQSFVGSHVIVTVPLGVLKAQSITFDPPLPAAKRDVIRRIGFGHVEKVTMTFENAFWRSDPQEPSDFFRIPDPVAPHGMFLDVSPVAGSGPGAPASPCLAYICGTATAQWAADNPDEAVERVMSDLESMFPDTFEPPVASACSNWSSSPFSRGCYPYASVDTRPGDFAVLGEPTHGGSVLFAGDACADGTFLGNVEGALVSGERAADVILNSLQPTSDRVS
jgi:polyamine oxidase